MPAEAFSRNPSAKENADSVAGKLMTQISLLIDVQFSDALAVDLPGAADFELWAQQAFVSAATHGWDAAWRARINPNDGSGAIDSSELCIRLVDADEGEQLNATWRDKHSPTNVLSFSADIVAGQYAPLGDLVLCGPVVVREAGEQGKTVAHHCAHLVVHGVLHLLGFDHLIDSEAEAMEAMEAAVLGELGIGNPYE